MVEHREGELLGPVDWNYDFNKHNGVLCCSDQQKAEITFARVERLWKLERAYLSGKELRVCTSGQFWHDLIAVGMYDGWPFWTPTPAICYVGPLGGAQWDFFYELWDMEEVKP
jgi:hypothetical protein